MNVTLKPLHTTAEYPGSAAPQLAAALYRELAIEADDVTYRSFMVPCCPQLVHEYLQSKLAALMGFDLLFYAIGASRNKSPYSFNISSEP